MITERELRRVAGRIGLGVGQAEHEYVILCALNALSQTPLLSETLCLKGGTALRQLYFPDWRHSVDLDFSVLPAFPAEQLKTCISVWFEQVETLHGVQVLLGDYHRVNGAARLRARFVGRHYPGRLLDVTPMACAAAAAAGGPATTSSSPPVLCCAWKNLAENA